MYLKSHLPKPECNVEHQSDARKGPIATPCNIEKEYGKDTGCREYVQGQRQKRPND